MTGSRPRARLTGGGPTWELRVKKPTEKPPAPPVPEADALMALNEALVGIGVAAQAGDFAKAWALRRAAWGYADLLPPGKTRRQRRQLGLYRELLRAAQKAKRRA